MLEIGETRARLGWAKPARRFATIAGRCPSQPDRPSKPVNLTESRYFRVCVGGAGASKYNALVGRCAVALFRRCPISPLPYFAVALLAIAVQGAGPRF